MRIQYRLSMCTLLLVSLVAITRPIFAQVGGLDGRNKEAFYGKVRAIGISKVSVVNRQGRWFEDVGTIAGKKAFDREARLIEEVQYDEKGVSTGKWTYAYDYSKSQATAACDTDKALMASAYSYTLNDTGKAIRAEGYNRKGDLLTLTNYAYDATGKLVEQAVYFANGSLFIRNRFEYDALGNEISYSAYNGNDSLLSRWSYYYDSSGNLISEVRYDTGTLSSRLSYKYDSHRNKIEERSLGADGTVEWWFLYEYEYDQLGNWIKQTTHKAVTGRGEPVFQPDIVTYRNIEYY